MSDGVISRGVMSRDVISRGDWFIMILGDEMLGIECCDETSLFIDAELLENGVLLSSGKSVC